MASNGRFEVERGASARPIARCGNSLDRVSEDLDVSARLLLRWAQMLAGAPAATSVEPIFPGSGYARTFLKAPIAHPIVLSKSPEAELQRLRRKNERLCLERDFLRKAAVFFQKELRKHALIARHCDDYPVTVICNTLGHAPVPMQRCGDSESP